MSSLPFPKELFEQYAAEYQSKINKSQQEFSQLRAQMSGEFESWDLGRIL